MPTVLVTGAGGQLGQEFRLVAQQFPSWTWLMPTRAELDITDAETVAAYFATHQPNYCLNTAAYTAVDHAETEQAAAYACNETAATQLAQQCRTHNCQLVHFSTDYVYRSTINRPLVETDPTDPTGVYAASKLAGDQGVVQTNPAAMIVRTSWVYSSFGHNFVKTMLRLGRERDELRVVFDQVGTPTYARDLAVAIVQIIREIEDGQRPRADLAGLFHYSNEGVTSWYDFALAIFELTGIDCAVYPIESKEYPTPVQRPPYSVLNKAKFRTTFGQTIPHWREGLKSCLAVLTDEKV
ncbi:MAG: dTDP-4-dehydrorhamnose reductase [Bacteroidota bacterium]